MATKSEGSTAGLKPAPYSADDYPSWAADPQDRRTLTDMRAKQKVAAVGDLSNTTFWQKKLADWKYDNLIATDPSVTFLINFRAPSVM